MRIIGKTEQLGKDGCVLKDQFGLAAIDIASIEVGKYDYYFDPQRCCIEGHDVSGVRSFHILKMQKPFYLSQEEAEAIIEKVIKEGFADLRELGDYYMRMCYISPDVSIHNEWDEDFEPSPIYVKVIKEE